MNTNTITEEQVREWLAVMYVKCREIISTGATQVCITCDNFGGMSSPNCRFEVYNESIGHGGKRNTMDKALEAFAHMAGVYTPEEQVRRKREQAAALLAQAEEIEKKGKNNEY